MKLQNSLVLVRVDPVVEQMEEGIFIQDEWKDLPPTGTVEDVGEGVTFCKKGDKVFFTRYAAIEFPGDDDLRVCKEDGILAVL